jgi:hypothetical protein
MFGRPEIIAIGRNFAEWFELLPKYVIVKSSLV